MKNKFNTVIKTLQNDYENNMYKIVKKDNRFYFGIYNDKSLKDPITLSIDFKDTLMDDLLESLIINFNNIESGYSMSLDGIYEYYTIINGSIILIFPSGLEYNEWIVNELVKEGKINRLTMYKN